MCIFLILIKSTVCPLSEVVIEINAKVFANKLYTWQFGASFYEITWLTKDTHSSSVMLSDYDMVRPDSPDKC